MNDVGSTLVAHCGARKVTREELKTIPVPEGTKTHQPLSHHEIVEVLDEALSFRNLSVVKDEYAVSHDGMKMFGIMGVTDEERASMKERARVVQAEAQRGSRGKKGQGRRPGRRAGEDRRDVAAESRDGRAGRCDRS